MGFFILFCLDGSTRLLKLGERVNISTFSLVHLSLLERYKRRISRDEYIELPVDGAFGYCDQRLRLYLCLVVVVQTMLTSSASKNFPPFM